MNRRYNLEYLSRAMTLEQLANARYTGADGDELVFEVKGMLVRLHPKRIVVAEPIED